MNLNKVLNDEFQQILIYNMFSLIPELEKCLSSLFGFLDTPTFQEF